MSVPLGTPNLVVHEELGVLYLQDILALRPLMCWIKCWLNDDLGLTQQILREATSLDNMTRIPWLVYVKKCFLEMGRPDLFTSPESISIQDIDIVKSTFFKLRIMEREAVEIVKPSVRKHVLITTSPSLEPYLLLPLSTYERFVLIRFRLDYFNFLLAVPRGSSKGYILGPCGCDGLSPQDLSHFLFICKYYEMPRKMYLKPFLKPLNFRQIRPALLYLQLLHVESVPFIVGFLKLSLRFRVCLH